MKRLAVYDFDGTLMDSPHPEEGVPAIKEKTGKEMAVDGGWWSRPESLDTEVFDIKPFPSILAKLREDMADPETHTIILTARQEKLRPELENVLKVNNIKVDDVLMKDGADNKGDTLLRTAIYNPDLERIDVYDDMQNKESKLKEFTDIIKELPNHIEYNIYHVDNGKVRLLESSSKMKETIFEEIIKFK